MWVTLGSKLKLKVGDPKILSWTAVVMYRVIHKNNSPLIFIVNQAFCIDARTDLIPPSLWPPNSPDLSPVGYAVWGIL